MIPARSVALVLVVLALGMARSAALASPQATPVAVRCSTRAAAPTYGDKPLELTGAYEWPSTPSFHWYVRQAGTCVYAMYQAPGRGGIAGIFAGGIRPNLTITGIWSDVPYTNDVEGHGKMVWKVGTAGGGQLELVVVSETGGAAVDRIVLVKKVTPTG